MPLEKELEIYHSQLPKLLADGNEGKFVLIHRESVVDVFGAYEDAIKEGYAKFGLKPFLVKRIQAMEQTHLISRLLPCHTLPAR
jgi:hypothetical protein